MNYLFKQKFLISDLAEGAAGAKKILIAEPEIYLRQLYSRHLADNNFQVCHSQGPSFLENEVLSTSPHLLILSINFGVTIPEALYILKRIRYGFPALPVVTLGYNLEGDELKELMSAGVSSHVDRRFTRPMDVVMVAKTLLINKKL